jgi:PAS domain S-box-containing protein
MLGSLASWLFVSSGLTPHGFCLLWEPRLIWTHAAADLAIGLAYFTIPVALAVLARRRRDLVFRPLVLLFFAAFILLCGVTHWLDLLTLWVPAYGLQAIVKVATAVVSVATAILWQLLPQAVALPSSAQLQVANERLALATDCSRVGIWDWDIATNEIVWDDWMYRLYGMEPRIDYATYDEWKRRLHPDDLSAAEQALNDCIDGTRPFDTEFRVVWNDGSIHHLKAFGRLTRDATGRALRMVGTNFDVTESRQLVAELARMSELQVEAAELENAIFRNSPDSLYVVRVEDEPAGPAFVYEAFSPAFERLTGMRIEDLVGRRPEGCLSPELAAAALERFRRGVVERSTITAWSASYVLPVGTRDFEGSITPIVQPTSGKVVRLVGTMRDVTERRVLEAALHHGQRMEAIGRLSAGVAHDFNNILQSIVGGLELILDEFPTGTSVHEFADIALNSALRGSSLTHQLLSYAGRQLLRPEAVALEPFLAEIRTLLAPTLGPHIAIRVRTDQGPAVWADPGQLQTALVNLAINARDAMPQGGQLYINARTVHEADQTWVAIAVTDTGTGMDETTLAQAMDPFFTTKGPRGTGLGLSMVKGFAEQSDGKVEITSTPGEGTTVELRLPLTASDHPSSQTTLSEAPRMLGRILLVDDSTDLLLTIGTSLEKAGFAVTRADGGHKALALLTEDGGCFDAIVSDYAMPGVNGVDLIAAARIIHPGLRAVLITGYADLVKVEPLPAGILLLHKPFGRDDLIDTLKRLMLDRLQSTALDGAI